ncbi:carbohydrate kinase family protein [Adhaeretor mobilis]|uniref:Putative sugar kinase YdjH n=1 Tax=Adhaeretor mobilis TaxID=1930276 RepID=A0A517MUZ0_9BACT|nr:carbohydrate kinase family protein [Adhaeretor mobilis]QDS98698.1 putative sugar kinase YdjH [Adhaeretor mobilis]
MIDDRLLQTRARDFDCIVCGSCVVDVLVRPVDLSKPIGGGRLVRSDPMQLATGGIVSNSGVALARLGMKPAAFTYVGNDDWADIIRQRYESEGLDAQHLLTHETAPTSTTVVLIDEGGERTFLHAVGAPKKLNKHAFLDHIDLFGRSRAMLLGYFPLLPNLLNDLPEVLQAIRETGCVTALDTAGDGGSLSDLAPVLPHLDLFVPSLGEARHQTGLTDPSEILQAFRDAGATGLLGVKLGEQGALLSPTSDEFLDIAAIAPPGEVVDTTGAGDSFLAGLLTGLLRGLSFEGSGRLAAAVGAMCVTGLGASTAIGDYAAACQLCGLPESGLPESGLPE